MLVWPTGAVSGPRFIINFPTKRHWRGRSHLDFVVDGLVDLSRVVTELELASVAVPALGCGLGGLDWDVVRPLIENTFAGLATEIWLYPPAGEPGGAA